MTSASEYGPGIFSASRKRKRSGMPEKSWSMDFAPMAASILSARRGSSGGSASGRGFRALRRDVSFVGRRVHQPAQLGGVGQAHFDQPRRAVWIGVDFFWRVLEFAVGFNHLARSRRVNFADGLHRLHCAKGLSGFDFRSRLGQLDEYHIAKLMF